MAVNLNQVKFLHQNVIEQASWNLLCDYSKSEKWKISTPIPVEQIAEVFLGYVIDLTVDGIFSDASILGGIIFEENVIRVNGFIETQDGRFNFTVAHEIGHHILHKDWFYSQKNQQSLFSTKEVPTILCRDEGEKPRGEIQADKFAASLLMPESLIKKVFIQKYKYKINVLKRHPVKAFGLPAVVEAKRIAEEVIKSGDFTNVSKIAMVNRLINLGLITGVNYQKNDVYTGMEFVDKA